MMATTLDGIIAKDKNQNADWTSKADKKAFVEETKKYGAIIMGMTTFQAIGRPLPGRLNLVLTPEPEKMKDKQIAGNLEFVSGTPEQVVKLLESRGFQSAILGGGAFTNAKFLKAGQVDEILITIEPKLFGRGINFIEGEDFNLDLELIENKQLDSNVIQLRYKVKKSI